MENTDSNFEVKISEEKDFLSLLAKGSYSLLKANNLFKRSIDTCLLRNKGKVLIDVTNITGTIPFFERLQFSEYLAKYRIEHALTKVNRLAVVGQEPIVHEEKFGETVAVNRGTNIRVFTDLNEALSWLNLE